MKEKVITITADGKYAYGLYDDNLPYRNLGPVESVRASEVQMNKEGFWEVFIIAENQILPKVFERRSEAIAYEIEYLNNKNLSDITLSFNTIGIR